LDQQLDIALADLGEKGDCEMLDYKNIEEIVRVNDLILECSSLPDLQNNVLSRLEGIFRTSACYFHPRHASSWRQDFERFASRGFPAEFPDLYKEKYYKDDPYAKHIRDFKGAQKWTVSLGENLVDQKELVESKFYQEFMRPFAVHHSMLMVLTSENRQIGLLGLFRSRHEKTFSRQDCLKAQLLEPALTGALIKVFLRKDLLERDRAIECILACLRYQGLLILDKDMRPILVNAKASELIGQARLCGEQAEAMSSPIFREITMHCAKLSAGLGSRSNEHFAGRDSCVELESSGMKESSTIYVRPVINDRENIHFVVYFDSEGHAQTIAKWAGLHGITPRETDVLLLIQTGLKNHEIAKRLFVSLATVQTHITHIFEKLEVRNRTGLLARIQKDMNLLDFK